MVAVHVKIHPGRGLVQLPVSGGHIVFQKGGQFTGMIQALVCSDPDAVFVLVDLTGAVSATSAWAVTRMLGAP